MADWPRVVCQITQGPTRKGRYNGKRAKEDAMANVQRKIQWQFVELRIGKSVKDNRWEIKRRFRLVVKLITNEYYMDSFRYLFHPLLITPSRSVDST